MLKQDAVLLHQEDMLIGGQTLYAHSLDANVKNLLQVGYHSVETFSDALWSLLPQSLSTVVCFFGCARPYLRVLSNVLEDGMHKRAPP